MSHTCVDQPNIPCQICTENEVKERLARYIAVLEEHKNEVGTMAELRRNVLNAIYESNGVKDGKMTITVDLARVIPRQVLALPMMEMKQKWKECIADLAETDRETARKLVRGLLYLLRRCVDRLQGYEASVEDIFKVLHDIELVRAEAVKVQNHLVQKHKLPGLPVRF